VHLGEAEKLVDMPAVFLHSATNVAFGDAQRSPRDRVAAPLDSIPIDAYTSRAMASPRSDPVSELSTRVAAECAGGGLRRASRAITRFYEAALAPLDLTGTQFSILVAVHLRGRVPLSRLAEGLVLDRTSLYRAVKPLVRRRCLRILPGQTRRERTAALTEAGQRLLADALPIWKQVQERFVGALGPQAWAALTSGLRQVVPTVQALESGSSQAGSRPAHPRAGQA
jgi:DNA-binding MarR family transcriptional regulator